MQPPPGNCEQSDSPAYEHYLHHQAKKKKEKMKNFSELLKVLYLHHKAKQEKINTKCSIFS